MSPMTRHTAPERIHLARRDAIRNRLLDGGMDREVAERWCDAWEAEAVLEGVEKGADYWDSGKRWIDTQCAARRQPPN